MNTFYEKVAAVVIFMVGMAVIMVFGLGILIGHAVIGLAGVIIGFALMLAGEDMWPKKVVKRRKVK